MGHYGGGFMGFGVIFWVLIILGVILLAKWLSANKTNLMGSHDKKPLEILKERYARGELNREEFEEKKRDLEQ